MKLLQFGTMFLKHGLYPFNIFSKWCSAELKDMTWLWLCYLDKCTHAESTKCFLA